MIDMYWKDRYTFGNKMAGLLILVSMVQRCLSYGISSYFVNNDTSVLMVKIDYDCRYYYTRKTPFEGVQAMIDHLIDDYQSQDGKLSKKPSTIIMQLNLMSESTICQVVETMKIFNPFVLGKHKPEYKETRRKKGDTKCCIDLEYTYDLQLIIQGANQSGKRAALYQNANIVDSTISYTYLNYFPTVKFRNIAFIHKYRKIYTQRILVIVGYEFGKDIDSSPMSERLKRFKKSQLMFYNLNIKNDLHYFLLIKSTFSQIDFKKWIISSYVSSKHFIYLLPQMDQYEYLGKYERQITGQIGSKYQIRHNFSDFFIWGDGSDSGSIQKTYSKRGILIYINSGKHFKEEDDNWAVIDIIVSDWIISKSSISRYNPSFRTYSIFMTNKYSKIFTGEIDKVYVINSIIQAGFFQLWNLRKFDNIIIKGCTFYVLQSFILTNQVKSYNVRIWTSKYYYRLNFLQIRQFTVIDKQMALQQSYKSSIKKWSIYSNSLLRQSAITEYTEKSIICYIVDKSALSDDLGSSVASEIEQLRNNLGLEIDDLQVKNVESQTSKTILPVQQRIEVIHIERAFSFELSNSKFIENQYSTSNVLDGVSYININNVTVKDNIVPFQLSYNSSIPADEVAYTRVFNILYFFRIISFHDIQIDSIELNSMVFESSLFKIEENKEQLLQTKLNGEYSTLDVSNIQIDDGLYLKPSDEYGSSLIHVSNKNPIKFTFSDSTINKLRMYQQMRMKNDMGLIVYFNDTASQKSQFIASNLDIRNSGFQYRKGLFVIQAQKVAFEKIEFINNQYQDYLQRNSSDSDNFLLKFDKMESKGCLMDVHAQKLEINNVNVKKSSSKEAAVLKLVVDQPTDLDVLGLDDDQFYVLKVQNSTFSEIMTQSGSILFDVDLSNLNSKKVGNNIVLSFEQIKVENVFSFKSGPIFNIYDMNDEKINIINSEFRSFRSGSAEQLISYQRKIINIFKSLFTSMFFGFMDQSIKRKKMRPQLSIENCMIDNMKMINNFIKQYEQVDVQGSIQYGQKQGQSTNKKYVDKLIAYTDQTKDVQIDDDFNQQLSIIEQQNEFKGGELINVKDSILSIQNSIISNVETLQSSPVNQFPLILKATQNSQIAITNISFTNLYPNQKGLFEVWNSKFSLEGCRFDKIQDLHYDGNSFQQQIKQQKQFLANDSYSVYNVFDNDKYMVSDNSKQFKGGLVAHNSTVQIINNRFERMKCKECNGLVLSLQLSILKVIGNTFRDNSAYQATCIYIEGKQQVDLYLKEFLQKKGDHYFIENATMQISDNVFVNNNAIVNSTCVYMKDIEMIAIEKNRFESNKGQYGSCLYSSQQNNGQDRSIVTNSNQFINNTAMQISQIYHQDIFIYNIRSNKFIDNKAVQFSSKVFSYPQEFKLNVTRLDGNTVLAENQYTLNNFGSNQQAIPLEFIFYDEMNEKINLNQYIRSKGSFSNIVRIESIRTFFNEKIKNSIYTEQESKQINEAQFTNPDSINMDTTWINNHLYVTASPLSQVVIRFRTNIVRKFNQTSKSFINGAIFKLIINFRECQIGEYYDKEQNYCQKCPLNTFSFGINQACKRQEKVQFMEKAYGEYKTSVKKGAWRSKNNTQNIVNCTKAHYCEPELQEYPDASNSSANHLCRRGHIGLLCQSCDHYGVFWNQTYQYSLKDKMCVSCSESSWTIIFFFLLMIAIGLFAAFTINKQVVAGQDLSVRQRLKSIKHLLISRKHRFLTAIQRIAANKSYCDMKKKKQDDVKKYPMKLQYKERDDGYSYEVYIQEGNEKTKQQLNMLKLDFTQIIQPTALIKIMVTYFLIFSITLESTKDHFKNMNWAQQVFDVAGSPVKQATYSLECFIISFGFKNVPVYVIKDTLTILSPLINWLIFLIIWRVILRSKVDKPVLINSLTFITFYNYPQIIQTVFPAVIRQRQDGIDYVQTDPKFFYQSQQQFYLRVLFYAPVLFFFLLVLPVMTILFLKKNKQRLFEADFRMKFGFLYQEYRQQCYYIEVVKIAVKVSIIMFQSIYIDSLQLQISVIQQVLLVYLIIIILAKPYIRHSTNTIELYNIILCLLNMILVNSIYWSQENDSNITTIIFIAIMIVFNLAFILLLIYFLFKQKIIEINESIINLKHTLLNAIPKLKNIKYFKKLIIGDEFNSVHKWKSLLKSLKSNKFQLTKPQEQYSQSNQDTDNKQKQDQQYSRLSKQQSDVSDNPNRNKNDDQSNKNDDQSHDVHNVTADDIVQYFKVFRQEQKTDANKSIQIEQNKQSITNDDDKPIEKNEPSSVQDSESRNNYSDMNRSIKVDDIGLKNEQGLKHKDEQIFEMEDASVSKISRFKNK